jgi:predicted alpha/beta superfamily hydrolase
MTMTFPGGVTGLIKSHKDFSSKFVDARRVDIWLPPGYDRNPSQRFPVVYMHDGQNLFDPKNAFAGVSWGIDRTMTRLIQQDKIKGALVVGVWNTPKRGFEYMPQKAATQAEVSIGVEGVPAVPRDQIISDRYLQFLVTELKPFIDATYRTLPDRKNTFVMGSSAGSLISAYAISEYPDIFGGAGCMSTYWLAGNGMMIDYLRQYLPDPDSHKLYFDYGTEAFDAPIEPYQQQVDEVMRCGGYTQGVNWVTKRFAGADHSERAWSQRVDIPLTFFLHP